MKLTPHFTVEEFQYSSTAIRKGIDNHVPDQYIPSLKHLCTEILEPLRQHVQEPVIISSGYRCPILNAAVGGSKTSQHMKGEAADIYLDDMKKLREWFSWLKERTDFDQLILERASKTSNHWWIHVSCKPDSSLNRHQVISYLLKS